ncbi:uncharacterized protein B0H64DRAFT_422489 [Chaetomium fimeti]|uniref:Carrier domain-containing protein n=1 Tax=Chaetomium fimeti TaxID=1854472 RepID=A0AAE0HN96_9PEZI|nr:hypothetical protein B0H64DRAFT_422489 [Chaetomium fimeti]
MGSNMDGITAHSDTLGELPVADHDGSPLSWFQQRLWVHQERNPDDLSYNLPFMLLVRGGLNVLALERSVNAIAARHESLRTSYGVTGDGEPLQFVAQPGYVHLPALPFLEHRFDLRRGPIFITRLLRLPDAQHLLLLNAILRSELQSAYAAFCRAQEPELPRLTRASDMSGDLEYWSETLKGYEDSLELPTTYPRQRKSGTRGGGFKLERLSRENGSTMFIRYADKDDLCIGTTTSNRPDVALEPLIGFFVNILPVADLLRAVRSQVLNAFEHPVPFERILQATSVAHRGSGQPLVPIVMRHQNFPEASLGAALPDNADEAVLEIELSYAGGADGLAVEVVYAADLYDRAAIERLLAHHQNVLEGMFRDAGQRVLDLSLLRDSDVAELLKRSNFAPTVEVPPLSFVDRFDKQVQRSPEAVACWDGHGSWSYLDLSRRAHSVAHALAMRGTTPGDLVAVCLPRGGELLATLLGVWRAGAAYVPLDPAYPAAYSRQIIDDAGPSTVICDAKSQMLLDVDDSRCLRVEEITDSPGVYHEQALHPDALAYPKGVRRSLPFQPGEVVVKEMFSGLLNGIPQVTIDDGTVRDVPLSKAQVLGFRDAFPDARLFNNYGCTEVNDVTYYDTAAFDGAADFVPIGTPIANTKVYVLDRHGRLVPDGVPGELHVASVMGDYEGITAGAVVARGDRLAAFYTSAPDQAVQMAELRAFLQDRLPEYMVPDTFVLLDAMPQLPNGKLNRRALLETEGEPQQTGGKYEAPASATERTLAGIWGVVVNMPAARIGRQTHFFEIGGHSLSAMRVLARIKDTFRVELGLSELFSAPRLESIAAVIDSRIGHRPSSSGELPSATRAPRPARGFGLLHDKVALVTGGSRGIGLSTALLLAEQGAKVAINYRDSKAQALSVKEMIEADGGTAEVFGADVTRADEVAAMVAAVQAQFGRIDVLVVNAHIHFRHRPFLEYEWADLEQKVSDELKAVFHPCRAVAPGMVSRGSGSIITLSSTLSKRSNGGFLAQSTAKAAVDALVRSLAAELGPHGVRANTVAPGVTLTDAAVPMAPHVKESVAAICPMRRNGLPEDMAGAVLFLASDLSRFMTGTYLPVDGGFTTL